MEAGTGEGRSEVVLAVEEESRWFVRVLRREVRAETRVEGVRVSFLGWLTVEKRGGKMGGRAGTVDVLCSRADWISASRESSVSCWL